MRRHYWTENELHLLTQMYPDTRTENIASALNMSIYQVYHKANKIGLRKTTQYLQSKEGGRYHKGRLSVETFFPKGHIPWNKGKKGLCSGGVQTQFKLGFKPHNTKHDGYISIRKDTEGRPYKYIRVSEGNWELLQRKVWTDHHGPIPEGVVISFRDGDPLNCEIENLIAITREENMLRNSIYRYPEEIVSTIRLRARLNKKIKKLSTTL